MLPNWPEGTVVTLGTAGGAPHAIPVSAAIRAGDDELLLALSHRRESLARLRSNPLVSVSLLAAGNVACTAYGRARVVAEPLSEELPKMVGVAVRVTEVQDHTRPDFVIRDGIQWHWTNTDAEARDAQVRAALRALRSRA